MGYSKLRKHKFDVSDPNLPPEIHDINQPGTRDPRFYGVRLEVPAKVVKNTKGDMELLRLHTHELKWENVGRVCKSCVNYYPERPGNMPSHHGRCLARGYIRVHEETPADDLPNGWTDPDSGMHFKPWYNCPFYTEKERLSRH